MGPGMGENTQDEMHLTYCLNPLQLGALQLVVRSVEHASNVVCEFNSEELPRRTSKST